MFIRIWISCFKVRSGLTWTMYSISFLVGLEIPFGFKSSHSFLEISNLRAKCSQFFKPGVSLSNEMATSSKRFKSSRREVIVLSSTKRNKEKKNINIFYRDKRNELTNGLLFKELFFWPLTLIWGRQEAKKSSFLNCPSGEPACRLDLGEIELIF